VPCSQDAGLVDGIVGRDRATDLRRLDAKKADERERRGEPPASGSGAQPEFIAGAGGASARAGLANIQPIVRLVMM